MASLYQMHYITNYYILILILQKKKLHQKLIVVTINLLTEDHMNQNKIIFPLTYF